MSTCLPLHTEGVRDNLWEFILFRVESKNLPLVVMLGGKHLNTTSHLRDFRLSLKSRTSPHPSLENDHSEEVQERPVWASSPQLLTTWPLTVFHNNHHLEFSLLPTHQTRGSCQSPKSHPSFRWKVPLPPRSPSPPCQVRSCLPHGWKIPSFP